MFSKGESKKLRQDFWIAFGKSYPRKWMLYHTKIKGLSLKFHFGTKEAMVSMDIESTGLERRIALWEKMNSLKSIIVDDYLPNAKFEDAFVLENQKEISRVYVTLPNVSIHDKDTWRETMEFLNDNMLQFEAFFKEYDTIFRNL